MKCWEFATGAKVEVDYQAFRGPISGIVWVMGSQNTDSDVIFYSTGVGYLVICRLSPTLVSDFTKQQRMCSCKVDNCQSKFQEISSVHVPDSPGPGFKITCIKPNLDGTRIMTGSRNHWIHVWDLDDAKQDLHLTFKFNVDFVPRCIAFINKACHMYVFALYNSQWYDQLDIMYAK